MSGKFSVLGNAGLDERSIRREADAPASVTRSGQYSDSLLRMFQRPSAVAVTASGADVIQIGVCECIAAELAASGKRVVVVPVDRLLLANPIRVIDNVSLLPGVSPNVWIWPSIAQQREVFSPKAIVEGENWLERLRRTFHTVILDCPPLEATPEVTEFAGIVDATILVVEANRTTRQQIRDDQLALEMKGAKLAGCILLRGRGALHAIPQT